MKFISRKKLTRLTRFEISSVLIDNHRNRYLRIDDFMAIKGYIANLEETTKANSDFRRVLYSCKSSQLVLMCLKPKEDIGFEVHKNIDQFFRFESGSGVIEIDGVQHKIHNGDGVVIPAGAKHNVMNSGTVDLKFYTIYSPPEHKDKVVRHTKADAEAMPEEYDGKPSE